MPTPEEASFLGQVQPLDARRVLVSGLGGVDLEEGRIELWGSEDGGGTWTQFSDPVFTALPQRRDAMFFALAATRRGRRIYAPSWRGTLLLGRPGSAGHRGLVARSLADTSAWDRWEQGEDASIQVVLRR